MTARQPSGLALAVLDFLVPGDAPLKGDVLEEFQGHQSQWWLWRQVIGAVIYRRQHDALQEHQPIWIPLVGIALLVLVSFEVVFATNVMYRLLFGPPVQDVTGYLYLFHKTSPSLLTDSAMPWHVWIYRVVIALTISMPAGWWLARKLNGHSRRSTLFVVTIGATLWTAVNLQLPFAAQFLSMLSLTLGFVAGGQLAATSKEWMARG